MVASSNLLPNGRQQFLDGNGKPLAGGSVYFYVPNTTTFKATWQDDAKVSQNTNPVLLDANGSAVIFGDGEYRQVLKDAFGTTLWDEITLQFVSFSGGDLEGNLPNPTLRSGVVAQTIESAPTKTSIADLDEFAILDSTQSFNLANVAWSVVKNAFLSFLQGQTIFASNSAPGAGYSNLNITVNSNTSGTVAATALSLANATGDFINLNNVNTAFNITLAGAGGLDSGSEAANTWYYVWVIYNPTTSAVAALISASASTPVLPSGFTFRRRFGAIRNDGSSNLLRSVQRQGKVNLVVGGYPTAGIQMAVGPAGSPTVPTWVAISLSAFVPPTAGSVIGYAVNSDSSNHEMAIAPNGSYGGVGSAVFPPPVAFFTSNTSVMFNMALEQYSIYWAGVAASNVIYLLGWEDML